MFYLLNDAPIKYAYIDPGTGSMLLTILVGALSVLSFSFRSLFNKVRILPKKKVSHEKEAFTIYTDSKRYWNTFKSICDEFEKNKINISYLTQSEDDPVFLMDYEYVRPEFIGEGNRAFSRLNYLNSDFLLSTTPSLDVYQWKRSKDVRWYVHIPHACSDITLYRLYGIDYYDAILTSCSFQIDQIRKLEEFRKLPAKETVIVGLAYFDEMKKRLDSYPKKKNDIPVVLLAPSWGPSSLLNRYGEELINSLIDTGYQIIIRPHPQSFVSEKELIDHLMNKYPDIIWNRDNDNFDVLYKADIMVSDFSGVIFDFAIVFDKPVVYSNYEFDDSVYDAHWLNEKTWTETILPEIGRELKRDDFLRIKEVIDDCLTDDKYSNGRKKAKSESWANQGNSAKAIFEYMVLKEKEINGLKA